MRRLFKTLLKIAILAVLAVLLVPYLLVPLYSVGSIRPVSVLMLRDYMNGEAYERRWVEFEAIAPVLVQSVLMSEDGRYCAHDGVDWEELNLVIDDALEGESTRGASTIAMQTVKNLFLWPSRSFIRKGLEVPLALYADAIWSKARLMELYLNVAEFSPGIYGVGAAADFLFGTSADKLTSRQAALLAVTLPNPAGRNPSAPSQRLLAMARTIEGRARRSGAYIKCLYG